MNLRSLVHRATAPKSRRSFDAASSGRGWGQQRPFGGTSAETLAAFSPIRARARAAHANNPHARAAVEAWVSALVGTGARATPTHPDPVRREAIALAIEIWTGEADADGRSDWYGLQANIARAMVIDGEALVLLIDTPDGLRLRQIPSELLDESETRSFSDGRQTVGGVEFNAAGQRVAYWIRPEAPTSPFSTGAAAVRVDAANVLHVFKPLGAGQVRGVSWLAPVLLKLSEIDQLSDALLVGLKTSAMFAGFLKDTTGATSEFPFDGDRAGSIMTDGLEPGTLKVLPSGYDISFATPAQAQQSPDFLSAELRAVAVGMGVPAHLVSGDLRQANYSSLRADMVAFRQRVSQIQYGTLAPQLLRPVHARAVRSLVLTGTLNAPAFETRPSEWTGAEWIFAAPPGVDPKKDAEALRELMDAGLMSRREAVAERGWNVEALDAEIAADRAREAALGLTFGTNPQSKEPGNAGNA
ncbi:MAG: lambda family phage portal protein [Brevundimonas sp.]|jgi:lambda family phage portal protein|uniref:phage portal protein n=1 Tax=Brevundimonas sp. TaxID=1871086 RepID=UPI0039E3F6B3